MRNFQTRQTFGGNHGIEALRFRAEVHRLHAGTIHAKNPPSLEDGSTEVTPELAVFTRMSADQKRHKPLTYWIVISLSLILIREAWNRASAS